MKLSELLSDEVLKQVKSELSEKDEDVDLLVNTSDNEYVPRERLNDKSDQIETLKDQLDDRKQQLKTLKEDSQTSQELKEKIEKMENQHEEELEQLESEMQQKTKRSEVRIALAQEDARNVDAVESLLDMDEIEVDGDEISGLEDQLEGLKESESYLFDESEGEEGGGAERSGGEFSGSKEDIPEKNPFSPGNIKPDKQAQILQDDPDLARRLIQEAGKDPTNYGISP